MSLIAVFLGLALGQLPHPPPPDHPVLPQFYMPVSFGPSLSEVRSTVEVHSDRPGMSGDVVLPTPSSYSGQLVIAFRVECDPPGALKDWKWEDRPYAQNSSVRISVTPPAQGATVSFTARVLTPGESVVRTQTKDFLSWLAPSSRIASRDVRIAAIAKELGAGKPDREELVKRAERWVAKNQTDPDFRKGGSDSISALASGGDSLGRACLCAALLRASGVPARLLAYSPTWGAGVEAAFWLTEYETDDGAWDWVDPTVGILHLNRDSIVVMDVPAPNEENTRGTGSRCLHPSWPPGSNPETTPGLSVSRPKVGFASNMHLMATFPFASGARLFSGSYPRQREVMKAAMAGQDAWFNEAQFQAALQKGPINLALFIGGRPTLSGNGPLPSDRRATGHG